MTDDSTIFKNTLEVLGWLRKAGYKVGKSKLYADAKVGMLPAGACTVEDAERYARRAQAETPGGGKGGADRETISGLDELAALLRAHPVQIRVAPDGSRVHIREKQDWKAKNWETSKRISDLVFFDCAVLEHILALGLEVVDGRNIMRVVE